MLITGECISDWQGWQLAHAAPKPLAPSLWHAALRGERDRLLAFQHEKRAEEARAMLETSDCGRMDLQPNKDRLICIWS